MRKNYYEYLGKNNVETGKILGHKYWIVEFPLQEYNRGALNGYVHFKARPTTEKGYQGILTYVPVHGGITLAEPDGKIVFPWATNSLLWPFYTFLKPCQGMIYGFDTGHCDSEKYPRADKAWIKRQIGLMLRGDFKGENCRGPLFIDGICI